MSHPKRLLSQVFALILLVVAISITGCSNGQAEEPPPVDVPSISGNEARAMVTNYLQVQINDLIKPQSMAMQNLLNKAAPSFSATYIGKGQWRVVALGYGYNTDEEEWRYYYKGGLWNVYETSKIVEPYNTQARNLLEYWQRYKE